MNKELLEQYIDACELIKETEKDILRLKCKRRTIVQTNVRGSNPDFPYQEQHFQIQGTTFTYRDDRQLLLEEKLLAERRKQAVGLKLQVEAWMNTIPSRMQRIIRYKVFEQKSWEEVAGHLGRKATGEGVRKEFERFFEKF